jgi:hypothetical protein
MPGSLPGRKLAGMSNAHHTRVVVDLEHGEDAVSGRLEVAGRPAVSFIGWLELISALGRVNDVAQSPRLEVVRPEQR